MLTRSVFLCAALLVAGSSAIAQESEAPPLGEVMVSASRQNAPFYRQDRPVVGLRRPADGAVLAFSVTSDSRDFAVRKEEIQAVLASAIDKAKAGGFELMFGSFRLETLTQVNRKDLNYDYGGRVDTNRVTILAKTKLDGSAEAVSKRLETFIKSLKGSGRATVDVQGTMQLTIVNPDQYRDTVIRLVAEDAKHNAALFGPEFTFNVSGVDQPLVWTQVSSTEVFVFVPYRYSINPK